MYLEAMLLLILCRKLTHFRGIGHSYILGCASPFFCINKYFSRLLLSQSFLLSGGGRGSSGLGLADVPALVFRLLGKLFNSLIKNKSRTIIHQPVYW
jgi:hypothetical protein